MRSLTGRRAVLLALFCGSTWALVRAADAPLPRHAALARRDCAPWDGSAFTVTIAQPGKTSVDEMKPWIRVSIWKDPDIAGPVTFRFPDETGKVGVLSVKDSAFPPVAGTVTFTRVKYGEPIEGTFDVELGKGKRAKGRFQGTWNRTRVMCG